MAFQDLANSVIPPAILSRIKIELRSHLLTRKNRMNGAAMGSIIAKVLQSFPDSTFNVRQYGGMLPFVDRFLSDSLKFVGPGAGGDPLFEGIPSKTDYFGLWRALTHPKSDANIVLDQQFNLHLLPTSTDIPEDWKRISSVGLQLQYEWASEFVTSVIPEEQKQSATDLLGRNTAETFTFEWISYLKRPALTGLHATWAKFRAEKIHEYFVRQLTEASCPHEKIELYNVQLRSQQASPRGNASIAGDLNGVNKTVLLHTAKNIHQVGLSTDLLKHLAHAYVDLAGENELRDLKITLGTIVDAISRLDQNKN